MARSGRSPSSASVVVVGVGERYRRDDGCGREVVAALRGRVAPAVRLVEQVGDLTALLDLWDGAGLAVVVDAMRSGSAFGTVARLEGDALADAPSERTVSSHAVSLRDTVELGRALGRMPGRLVLYLIEAGELGPGERLSPAVRRGVEEAAARIASEANQAVRGAPARS